MISKADLDCPHCGQMIEWCLGHPLWFDPNGWLTLLLHRRNVHARCVVTVCTTGRVA